LIHGLIYGLIYGFIGGLIIGLIEENRIWKRKLNLIMKSTQVLLNQIGGKNENKNK
jgi:thiamine transporter ThiT